VSTRKVDDLIQALGIEAGIFKFEVSRICAAMNAELEAFRQRPLDHVGFPSVFCDAAYVKARVRDREGLGLAIRDSEDNPIS